MAIPPDPALHLLVRLLLDTPGRMTALKAGKLVIDEIPEDRWFSEHWRWDQYEVVAREVFQNPAPWPIQINTVVACERICTQALRSRQDPRMLDRLGRLLNFQTREEVVAFAELFLNF